MGVAVGVVDGDEVAFEAAAVDDLVVGDIYDLVEVG